LFALLLLAAKQGMEGMQKLLTEAERLQIDLQKGTDVYCLVLYCWHQQMFELVSDRTDAQKQSAPMRSHQTPPCPRCCLAFAGAAADVTGSKLLTSLHAGREWAERGQVCWQLAS
jgi:hypothetical protein